MNERAPHLVFLLSSLHAGGAERVAATLANAWVAAGVRVTLVACYSGRGSCMLQLDARVRLVWLADLLRGPRFLRPVSKLLALRRLLRAQQPDQVLSFLTNVNVGALLASRGLGLRVVVSERSDPGHGRLPLALRALRRITYPWAHAVVAQTERAARALAVLAPGAGGALRVIPNPLNPEFAAAAELARPPEPAPDGRKRLLALGRFHPVKQFDLLITAFAAVAADCPDWDLYIFGAGPEHAACSREVAALGLEQRIFLPGHSAAVRAELACAQAFVLSSRLEGFPNAMLEAMAAGLPCIAMDCPSGPAELSAQGRYAHLVAAFDAADFARELRRFLLRPQEDLRALGRAASASVRARYALPAVLRLWQQVGIGAPATEHSDGAPAPQSAPVRAAAGQAGGAALPPPAPLLRVVNIITDLQQGGAESVLLRLLTGAPGLGAGVQPLVISLRGAGVMGAPLRAAGVRLYCMNIDSVWRILPGLWRLWRLLRAEARAPTASGAPAKIVVQTWMYHADLIGGLAARAAGIRALAWGIRNSGVDLARASRSARLAAWLCARLSRRLPAAIVVCAARAQQVHASWGYAQSKMRLINNGYDFSQWRPDAGARARWCTQWQLDAAHSLIGCVARYSPLKDHANLFAALAILQRSRPGVRCVLVGPGMLPANSDLMALADEFGVRERLLLLGERRDVAQIMPALDVHVLASRAEGFPNVLAEAMACAVACVSTDVGAAAEIMAGHGWLAAARDPQALAQAIDAALAARATAQWPQKAQAARASVVARYSLGAMQQAYASLWRALAAPAPRLVYFISNPGFFVSHRLPIARAALAAGYEVHLISQPGAQIPAIEALGIKHHALRISRAGINPWHEWRSFWQLRAVLRALRPDILHAVTIKAVIYGGLAARLGRVPLFVAAISGLGYAFIDGGWRRRVLRAVALVLYRLALRQPRCRVILQNGADKELLLRHGVVQAAQIRLLRGSGVDLKQFAPRPPPAAAPIVVSMAARLLRDKGVAQYAEAARISSARGDGVRWQLAGSPDPANPASISQADLAAWAPYVHYLGESSAVADLYAGSHIVALPSYREGLPKSLLEAAACARPVVTTDVPGCRDAIIAGQTGLLVPARDPVALADAVRRLAQDAALRARMGQAARELAQRDFAVEKIVAAHLCIYAEQGAAPAQFD